MNKENKNVFCDSSLIWSNSEFGENEYAEFVDTLSYKGGKTLVRLSVCGDYTLFVNGRYVSSGQYGDFAHYKIYDEIDITGYLYDGENRVAFLVWYFGKSGMRYLTETPGLVYEIETAGNIVSVSNENTLSRKSRAYESGFERKLSAQLGYSFSYNSASEDGWIDGRGTGFEKSCVLPCNYVFGKRPIFKHILKEPVYGNIVKADNNLISDLGEEYVGLCTFSIESPVEQKLVISYGELLENGHVKRIIGNRDFSFDYVAKQGENEYTNYMLRLACRYIEIESEYPVEIRYMGIIPQVYPLKEKAVSFENKPDSDIYDICLNTLRLCIMEHYVDCPWREQCLYAFDSRNQMLSGYIAFEDGNYDYARANLLLMSKDTKEDNIMSICYPSGLDLTIPSFSLYYVLAVKEYLQYSGDLSLGYEVFDKITGILKAFENNMTDELVYTFEGKHRWNFYDWSPYADGADGNVRRIDPSAPDMLINAIFVIALNAYDDICKKLGKINAFEGTADRVICSVNNRFYDARKGLYTIHDFSEDFTELANSLAVISGIADEEKTNRIARLLADNSLIPCSLSMKTFKYDAMLKADEALYAPYVISEIRNTYKKMLDAGSTTVWETEKGAKDFQNAGSLCHGWSAIPVYYYDKLGIVL